MGSNTGVGRPAKLPEERRATVGIRMDKSTIDDLRELADLRQMSQADVLAEIVPRELARAKRKAGARTYFGPVSLRWVEHIAGDFNRVFMKPHPQQVIETPAGTVMAGAVGLSWECGCETRGSGTPDFLPACVWSPCEKHEHHSSDKAKRPIPEGFDGGTLCNRKDVTIRPGQIVVLPNRSHSAPVDRVDGEPSDNSAWIDEATLL